MKMHVGKKQFNDDDYIPIWNDESGGYTLWVWDDPEAPEDCRKYAQEVAEILNTAPALSAENARLREACFLALETLSLHGLEDGDTAAALRAALAGGEQPA